MLRKPPRVGHDENERQGNMQADPKKLIRGILTFVPGLCSPITHPGPGGTESARYCYSVWLRHLVMAHEIGLLTDPRVVAELGPGGSIGTGMAALISGADNYYAFDVVPYASTERNLVVFDQLVEMFHSREKIPDEEEFPEVEPKLLSYRFPDEVLTAERLTCALGTERLARLRRTVAAADSGNSCVRYQVPWYEIEVVEKNSVDMIFSQAVLEHVDALALTYERMWRWLKPEGFMSHTIDFRCHGTAKNWNGHWTYSELVWKLLRRGRPYLINRAPCSRHIELIKLNGFNIVVERRRSLPSRIDERQFAPRFRGKGNDLTTSGLFIQAVK